MLATVVCGILCGARAYEVIADWLKAQEPRVRRWLRFWRKPPCANTFRNLLMALDLTALECAVRQGTSTFAQPQHFRGVYSEFVPILPWEQRERTHGDYP
jgi:hypothetical protein